MSYNVSFPLSGEQAAYLVAQMNQVSRSFALVVPELESPLDNIVATAYLSTLPYTAAGFRRACLMSLLPAYETLLLVAKQQEKLFTPKHRIKISRLTMAKLMQQLKSMVSNNENLSRYSEKMDRAIRAKLTAEVTVL